ncbi:MAG: 3-methyl-2-oxobutanoate hydroxymethyltransferase [Desulfovibrio sp.]|nr:3-methyl-2-oxobutanoate hydroxymethyltransferase [Desulfovibrio sp.]
MNTVATFKAAKGRQKLTMLTCYDYSMAKIMDECGMNALLVGDSLGMVMLGYASTIPVTLDEMVHHCAAVARGAKNSLIVCDLPFMAFQTGIHDTLVNAGRIIKDGGAQAVKLEGGSEFTPEIEALVRASIPVMGHIGLTPQSVNALGSYRVQGKDPNAAQKLIDDARALEKAGAFAIVLECVPASLGARITEAVSIPVIGIGAGPECDGQVLVWQDMTGIAGEHSPKFVRRFAEAGQMLRQAFTDYAAAVQAGQFPADAECYHIEPEILARLY